MLPFIRGFLVLVSKPKLWGYVWKPLALSFIVYVAIFAAGAWYLVPHFGQYAPAGWMRVFADVAGGIALAVFWIFVANFVFIALSALFSSFMWESLSRNAEMELYGSAPEKHVGCLMQISDGIVRILFAAMIIGIALLLGWLGIVIGVLAVGIICLFDFSAAAYLRRGISFPTQFRAIKAPAAPGFILCCGLLSLLPLIFIVSLPAMVIGGTILCKESEDPKRPLRDSGNA